jgi:dienelactone hydrolase
VTRKSNHDSALMRSAHPDPAGPRPAHLRHPGPRPASPRRAVLAAIATATAVALTAHTWAAAADTRPAADPDTAGPHHTATAAHPTTAGPHHTATAADPTAPGPHHTTTAADPTAPGPHHTATAEYDLGDTALRLNGYRNELAGVVHYPTDVTTGTHPLVVIAHGFFASCADRAAGTAYAAASRALHSREPVTDPAERERLHKVLDDTGKQLWRWPCAPGVDPHPSLYGYDYLGSLLASHGFVVVSVGVNGVNGGGGNGDDFPVRAAVVNRHLQMWQQLAGNGTGPLAGQLGRMRGHVDMTNVGTLGHSRGGRAAAYQASDAHRPEWPAGVQVKAAVALEPIISGGGDEGTVTSIPFATVIGACDSVSNPAARDYYDAAKDGKAPRTHVFTVRGANHNFFNTQWSPASGQPMAEDDAYATEPPFPADGNCRTTDAEHREEKQLAEDGQRRVGAGYVTAFFRRYLAGDTSMDPLLTGATHPLGAVDVEFDGDVTP